MGKAMATNIAVPTQAEILVRIEARRSGDFLGFEWQEYLPYLAPEALGTFLKDGVTDAERDAILKELSREIIISDMLAYMPFAWGKACDFRGISASRSIAHYIAWTWLAGDTSLSIELDKHYEFYGKPHLVHICEFYDWDSSEWDDGVRLNQEP